jgi:type II secretory pathway pseudopilin PulG
VAAIVIKGDHTMSKQTRRGFSLIELAAILTAVVLLLSLVLPALAGARARSQVEVSLNNLIALGTAHATYAADWNGRQFTNVVDDLSFYGDNENQAYTAYENATGEDHPALLLGWGGNPDYGYGLWGYWMFHSGNWGLCQPMVWPGGPSHLVAFGAFRFPNAKPFHDYVNGRFFGPTFYPPNDTVPYELVEPLFDAPWEFDPDGGSDGGVWWSSYCFSPAAMFNARVMAHPGPSEFDGWHNPWDLTGGFESPGFYQALYPDLKTQIIEHHWNQNAPEDPCNPAFEEGSYEGCEPYYFNQSIDSEPATLFYDLSVRLLPNTEVLAADEWMIDHVGYGLWSRDTPFGEDGYFIDYGYDGTPLSHHILTTDGILGRDTLPSGARAHGKEKRP